MQAQGTLTPRQQAEIRAQVASFFGRSPGYGKLPAAQKAQVLADTERIVSTMAEGRPADADPYAGLRYARGQQDVTPSGATGAVNDPNIGKIVSGGAKEMMDKSIGAAGSVIQTGVDQAARMIREIDFPLFVAKLIEGTFHAIVKSSIEQMKAYADMVRSVSTSLNDFRDRNTTDNQARDHLVSQYPSLLTIASENGQPKVTLKDGADTDNLPDFQKDLGLSQPVTDLDDETIETRLVPAARDDLARGRQQLLATIILMGINRIVVTDGRINAKIKFQFSAREKRQVTASAYDYAYMGQQITSKTTPTDSGTDSTDASAPSPYSPYPPQPYPGGYSPYPYSPYAPPPNYDTANRYATGQDETDVVPDVRVTSEVDQSSEGAIQASGQIMGEVSVNFKSDTFPLEKLVDTDQLQKLTAAQGAGRGAPPPPNPAATPAAAAGAAAPAATPQPPPPAPAPAAPAGK